MQKELITKKQERPITVLFHLEDADPHVALHCLPVNKNLNSLPTDEVQKCLPISYKVVFAPRSLNLKCTKSQLQQTPNFVTPFWLSPILAKGLIFWQLSHMNNPALFRLLKQK